MTDDRRWFHCTVHTYGAWLYGDGRGYRTRHHREHVEGDYKSPPPPGKYDDKLARSRRLMKQPPVLLPREWRPFVGEVFVERLIRCGAQLLTLSCGGQHIHLLAKMAGGAAPREWVGRAKMHVTFELRSRGWVGEVWAVKCGVKPINDYQHHKKTFHYILDHAVEGAWVWDFRTHAVPESPGPAGPGL